MAKVLVVSDIHGSENWKQVTKGLIDEVDHIVFMGDYVDAWVNRWPDQGMNLIDIFNFKKAHPDKVHVLWGNHDWSYMSGTREGSAVSGHQMDKHLEIRNLFNMNYKLIDLTFECDGVVFSHAGVSKNWLEEMKAHLRQQVGEKEISLEFLNDYLHKHTHDPMDGYFDYDLDALLDWHGYFRGDGDEVCQGPLWIRPNSLLKDAAFPKQVVGHTEYCIDSFIKLEHKNGNKVIVTDSHVHNIFEVIDTEKYFDEEDFIDLDTLYSMRKAVDIIINNARSRQPEDMKKELEEQAKKSKYKFDVDKLYEFDKFLKEEYANRRS